MREILFRGKCLFDGGFVEGFLFKTKERTYIAFPEQYDDDLFLATQNIFIEVDHETVGQYTGLTDKNGKKIFEGDIIAYTDYYGEELIEGIVKYGNFNCSCCDGVYGWYIDGGDIRSVVEGVLCVIGNIHDNPELLKGE